jgi:hypothetical protein
VNIENDDIDTWSKVISLADGAGQAVINQDLTRLLLLS